MLGFWEWEEISRKAMTKRNVVLCSCVDIELGVISGSTAGLCWAARATTKAGRRGTNLVPREDNMFSLEQGTVPRGLCAMHDEVVLPAAMLLPARPRLGLPDGFRCPEDRGKSDDKRQLLRHGALASGSTPH